MVKVSAEDKKSRKSQVALEFLMTYGWAILVILVAVGALAYFGFFDNLKLCKISPEHSNYFKKNCIVTKNPNITIESEFQLQDICNKLVVNNEVYPFLEVMGNGLKKENNAQFVAYKFPAELRSNLDIFNVDGLILCGVPTELCFTENDDIKGGTYCLNWLLEVPVFINDFNKWYQNQFPRIEVESAKS